MTNVDHPYFSDCTATQVSKILRVRFRKKIIYYGTDFIPLDELFKNWLELWRELTTHGCRRIVEWCLCLNGLYTSLMKHSTNLWYFFSSFLWQFQGVSCKKKLTLEVAFFFRRSWILSIIFALATFSTKAAFSSLAWAISVLIRSSLEARSYATTCYSQQINK